jgi:hypothetical protein
MSTSKTKTFTFRYIESVIQYEDVTEETTDSDGNKVEKIKNKVHFTVQINDDSISTLKYIAKDDGYFMCENSGSDSNNGIWTKVTKGQPIPTTSGLSLSTSDLNNIYYLDSIPDYSKETNFPDWLDPKPNMTPSDSINPQTIDSFIVKKDGYYLCNTTGKTSGVKPEEWTNLKAGGSIPVNQASDKTYYIFYIDKIPTSYVYGNIKDIAFNDSSNPPSYINVVLVDGEVQTLKYTTNANGYYKWDSNDAWVKMESGQDLVTSGIKDDTTIYYMDKLPEYNSSSYPLFTMEINENSGGNPTGVDIKAKVSGYYRYNSGTDWKYYSVGEIILTSKITDSNTMYNLESDSSTTFDLTITIIPKWWRL